jgi:hypothetical protein
MGTEEKIITVFKKYKEKERKLQTINLREYVKRTNSLTEEFKNAVAASGLIYVDSNGYVFEAKNKEYNLSYINQSTGIFIIISKKPETDIESEMLLDLSILEYANPKLYKKVAHHMRYQYHKIETSSLTYAVLESVKFLPK